MEYKETIINVETGEITERPYTKAEIKAAQEQEALNAEKLAEIQAEIEAKELQRQAILDRLGLTADEAKLLLG